LILPDTAAWIELLRSTGSPAHRQLAELLDSDEPILTTGVVLLEVLAGTRGRRDMDAARRLLGRCRFVTLRELADYAAAAALYRACRRQGTTIRRLSDCLIAAVAIRANASVLHRDSDFDALARYTPLAVVRG
jgi:predicted nucleic acid-binding protein